MEKIIKEICNKEVYKIIVYPNYMCDGSGIRVRFKTKDNNDHSIGFEGSEYVGQYRKWEEITEVIKSVSMLLNKEIEIIYER